MSDNMGQLKRRIFEILERASQIESFAKERSILEEDEMHLLVYSCMSFRSLRSALLMMILFCLKYQIILCEQK